MNARPPRPSAASRADMGNSTPARRWSNTGSLALTMAARSARSGLPSGVGATHDPAVLGHAAAGCDRQREGTRRGEVESSVECQQLAAIEAVELTHGIGGVVVAEPPEPVRALAEGELPASGGSPGVIIRFAHDVVIGLLGIAQQVPGTVLRGVTDPGR